MRKVAFTSLLFGRGVAVALLAAAGGCQSTVYLMPTPEAMRSGVVDPFDRTPEHEQTTEVPIGYATNRLDRSASEAGQSASGDAAPEYRTKFDQTLRLGLARLRIGDEDLTWDDLRDSSLAGERPRQYAMALEEVAELASTATDVPQGELSAELAEYFARLNGVLAASLDKNLTVYVHGANNNFYRSTAQAAQYRHFTGRHSVVMVFAWPSAASLLRYGTDVRNAAAAVPVFARLIELLSRYSEAEYINIIAYSAGAQVVSPALAQLANDRIGADFEQFKRELRLGEVYFAAPDVDFQDFVDHLRAYIGLPTNVSISVNLDDSVLRIAERFGGTPRAGRPPDLDALSTDDSEFIVASSRALDFDVIEVSAEKIPSMSKGSHGFWYDNPWVSTDVLIQLLFHVAPADRGLEDDPNDRVQVWSFPEDYPERALEAIERLRETVPLGVQGDGG